MTAALRCSPRRILPSRKQSTRLLRTEDQDDTDFERIKLTAFPEDMIASDGWKPVATRILGCKYAIRALLFVDQDWLVAVASRE